MYKLNKIGVFTSGGDSPGMNACIRAVVRSGIHHGLEVYGIMHGYEGMIHNDIIPLNSNSVSNIIQKGGTILKTARSMAFKTAEGRQAAYTHLLEHGINAIVAIGGDGTYTGAQIFTSEYPDIHLVGVPGTIDNDLYGTDYTIGYDTAINTAMEAIDKIRDTADATDRLFFVEVMGKDAGFIALRTGIGSGAEAVLIPETTTDIDELIATLDKGWKRHKSSSIIIVAEGDDAGGAFEIARKVKEKFDHYETRVSVLGHMQRGGRPTCADRVLASRLGMEAVHALIAGKTKVAAGIMHRKVELTPLEKAIKYNKQKDMYLANMVDVLSS